MKRTKAPMNYWSAVSKSLTEIVRAGGTIEADLSGIKIIGTPPESGAYEVRYWIPADQCLLRRDERDEFGRLLKREHLTTRGEWILTLEE
jgi:hypothetical protein